MNDQVVEPDNPDYEVLLEIEKGRPAVEKEVRSVEIDQKKENQFQVQVEEFLKLDTNFGETSMSEANDKEQDEKKERKSVHDSEQRFNLIHKAPPSKEKSTFTTSTLKQESTKGMQVKKSDGPEIQAQSREISMSEANDEQQDEKEEKKSVQDSEQRFDMVHKRPPSKEKGTFTTSTPKQESTKRMQVEKGDGPKIQVQSSNYAVKGDKQTSAKEFHFKVQIGNDINDAKSSSDLLLVQLVEVNKKLRMLQGQLLEFRKSNGILA